jgi:hypothetical protein
MPKAAIPQRDFNAKEAAAIIGLSENNIYKDKEKRFGAYHTARGWLFKRELVEHARAIRAAKGLPFGGDPKKPPDIAALSPVNPRSQIRNAEGETASKVFTLLESGREPVAIVIELKVAPALVRQLAEEHAAMRGEVLWGAEHVAKFMKLQLSAYPKSKPPTSAEMLSAVTASLTPPDVCNKCHRRSASGMCTPCTMGQSRQPSPPRVAPNGKLSDSP